MNKYYCINSILATSCMRKLTMNMVCTQPNDDCMVWSVFVYIDNIKLWRVNWLKMTVKYFLYLFLVKRIYSTIQFR